MGWSDIFKSFCYEYRLFEELEKIDIWVDFRMFYGNVALFWPSNSIKFGNGIKGTASGFAVDNNLDVLLDYENKKEIFEEVELARRCFSKNELILFEEVYVNRTSLNNLRKNHRELNVDWFSKDDILIAFAKNDQDYMFSEVIKEKYEEVKYSFVKEYEEMFIELRNDFWNVVNEHRTLVNPAWNLNDKKNLGSIKKLLAVAVMLEKGNVSKKDFSLIVEFIPRGNPYKRYLFNNVL